MMNIIIHGTSMIIMTKPGFDTKIMNRNGYDINVPKRHKGQTINFIGWFIGEGGGE